MTVEVGKGWNIIFQDMLRDRELDGDFQETL